MSRDTFFGSFEEFVPETPHTLRREELESRFRLYTATIKDVRAMYTARGANPSQAVRLVEPDTNAWRGDILPVSSKALGVRGHIIYERKSTGEEQFLLNLKFRVAGFTGKIVAGNLRDPLPLHLDAALDALAPIGGYCDWEPIPENVPYHPFDTQPLILSAKEYIQAKL